MKSGVCQGCILAPILFLIVMDWVMRSTTSNSRTGIQWTFFSTLEDLRYADDLALLSSYQTHLLEKSNRLCKYAWQVGLDVNTRKTQAMTVNTSLENPITMSGHAVEDVEDFTYVGSLVNNNDSGTEKDITSRIRKARGAFCQLRPIWKSEQFTLQRKIKLYNSNVKTAPLQF